MTPELQTRVAELLEQALSKRKGAREAHEDCNDKAERELLEEARVREGAAEYLDPSHTHESWHTEQ